MGSKSYTSEELERMAIQAKRREKEQAKKKKREQAPFDKKVIAFVLITSILVMLSSFYTTLKSGVEPSTTVTSWFAFAGVELWALAFLKSGKRKNNLKMKEREERDYE